MAQRPVMHMREFQDGDTLIIEPFRAKAFPVIEKDLMVDRSAFDRIMQAGGYVSVRTGSAPDAHAVAVKKTMQTEPWMLPPALVVVPVVASCPNAAAMLFTGAKVTHLGLFPQGQPERYERVELMVDQMDSEDFGHCTNFCRVHSCLSQRESLWM